MTVGQFKQAARTGEMLHLLSFTYVVMARLLQYVVMLSGVECLASSHSSLLCLELTYMSSLLQQGFGFKDSDVTRVSVCFLQQ